MLDFLQRVFGREPAMGTKQVAKERLRLVLVHDRAGMSPKLIEALREDLIKVISEYMEIDQEGFEVKLSHASDSVALVANIPILKIKRLFSD
ncbi:MAG: cell division topological specificity factor MinE [Syntrophomonadaceae bacterium]|jgi:cell division topological specificity factor|nr:cell division topological specificity factor MinE [Syntrophomonadaceae bacterium]